MRRTTFLLAMALTLTPFMAVGETAHQGAKVRAPSEVLNDPRVPIVLGSFKDTQEQPTVRIPKPRRR